MKNLLNYKSMIAVSLMAVLFSGCESVSSYEDEAPSIAFVAVANADFSVLEAAAIRGGVAGVLSNSNPGDPSGAYTVFAPTNDAFARLGLNEETLGVLQVPFLTNTLLYHVSNGNLRGSSFANGGTTSPSALGPGRRFVKRGNDTYINGSKILATDVNAKNGTVHVIDKVMIATGADIVQSAIALQKASVFTSPELSFLVEAVVYAGLAEALTGSPGSPKFTVFAPTDQAFKDLGTALGVPFNVPADIRKLPANVVGQVLLNHVFVGDKFTSELNAGTVTPLGGDPLTLGAFTNGTLTVRGVGNGTAVANMVIPDVWTTNGVVHVIDRVLLPKL
jgi:uncharacterized surface protein with fasciclin (FAS1) repeats